ncbi:phosphatase PAP2 family protein [Aquipuribacter nitratireducens]|uniref:Phosphatase PAP2 family protein n=1 Tax=Aquipuribacter nitratireducens TaxID=650104 RepID=A0ABW0GJG2_9MICO
MPQNIEMPSGGDTSADWGRLRGARARWAALAVLALVVAPCLALTGALFLSESDNSLDAFDEPVLEWFVGLREPVGEVVVRVYSALGSPVFGILFTFLAVVGLGVLWRSRTPFLLMLVAGAGSLAMSMTTKAYADRERPPDATAVGELEPSWSFPSGHALNATIIAGVLAYLFIIRARPGRSGRVAVVAVTLAVLHAGLMGLSRVYLGQHWFTDVAVGWAMGVAWLAVVLGAHQLFLRSREGRVGAAGAQSGGQGSAGRTARQGGSRDVDDTAGEVGVGDADEAVVAAPVGAAQPEPPRAAAVEGGLQARGGEPLRVDGDEQLGSR